MTNSRLRNPIALPISSLAPLPETFSHPSQIHGQAHVARVIIHTFLLIDALGLDAYATPAWAAAYVHDIARTHDGVCHEHGRNAIRRLPELPLIQALLSQGGVGEKDWEGISIAVENHCREELPKAHPHWTLTAILKDADGLDRVRLGDLDERYLRYPQSRSLVPFAHRLYRETNGRIPPGPDHFPTLWEVAQELLKPGTS